MAKSKNGSALAGAVRNASRGKWAGWICLAAAVIFGVSSAVFRREFLLWQHLVLVGVFAVLSGLCFAVVPTVLYARTKEAHPLRVFVGAFAFYQVVLWALLTIINVGGAYNRRAVGVTYCVLLPVFGVLCFLAFRQLARGGRPRLRKAAAIVLLVCFIVGGLLSVFQVDGANFIPRMDALLHGGEQAFFEDWSADQPFERSYAVELEKDPDKDFVVLNLADIQLDDIEATGEVGEQVKDNTDRLVALTQPDLITLTGDNAWGTQAYLELIKMLDSYGVPWAPVMGNHDGQGCPSEFWCAYKFAHAEHCVFRFGPAGMGYGNYIINITQNGEIVHTLFMMDTHSMIEEDGINGPAGDHYDHVWTEQLTWYTWAVDGIAAEAGRTVESTVIMHIPLNEYKAAWTAATGVEWSAETKDAPYVGEYADTCFGVRHENGGWPPESNGFFDLIKQKGSTKNVLTGHDHVCNSSILYQGVRLTYALKDGPGCYWEPELNGGTTITIGADGTATVAHQYIDFYGN